MWLVGPEIRFSDKIPATPAVLTRELTESSLERDISTMHRAPKDNSKQFDQSSSSSAVLNVALEASNEGATPFKTAQRKNYLVGNHHQPE